MNRFVYYGYPQFHTPLKNVILATIVEPNFTEHLLQHKGFLIVITTTVGKLVGILDNVFIDYASLEVDGKLHHIRLSEIVYFEKAVEKN
jgi:hypothetical protein